MFFLQVRLLEKKFLSYYMLSPGFAGLIRLPSNRYSFGPPTESNMSLFHSASTNTFCGHQMPEAFRMLHPVFCAFCKLSHLTKVGRHPTLVSSICDNLISTSICITQNGIGFEMSRDTNLKSLGWKTHCHLPLHGTCAEHIYLTIQYRLLHYVSAHRFCVLVQSGEA